MEGCPAVWIHLSDIGTMLDQCPCDIGPVFIRRTVKSPGPKVYVVFVFIGGIAELEAIWAFGDAALGIMTFPNLISIVLLTTGLKGMTKDYFSQEHTLSLIHI